MTADGVGTCGADDNQAQAGHLVVPTLTARYAKGTDSDASDASDAIIVQALAIRGRDDGAELEMGPEGGPYNCLRAGDGGSSRSSRSSLIAVTSLAVAGDFSTGEDVAQTVRAAHGQPAVVAVHENQRGEITTRDTAGLTLGGGKPGQGYPAILTETIVRRLTPLECERLQGFPDGHTEGQSDAQRYRQMGNAVAVPVVEWIARRLVAVDEGLA